MTSRISTEVVDRRGAFVLEMIKGGLKGVANTLRIELVEVSRASPLGPYTPYPARASVKIGRRSQRAAGVWVDACDADGQMRWA